MMEFPIVVKQIGILTDETSICDGKLFFSDGNINVEFEGYFEAFLDTSSRFIAILEIDINGIYEIFELTLEPQTRNDEYEYSDFEIEQDNEFYNVKSFLLKEELESKLNIKNSENKFNKV